MNVLNDEDELDGVTGRFAHKHADTMVELISQDDVALTINHEDLRDG